MLITILKCVVVIVALIIVWLFGYMVGVKIAIDYAAEMTLLAILDVIEEQGENADVLEFAERLKKKLNENF